MTKVAALQMASGPNVNANLVETEKLINVAVSQGAELIVLPENFAIMGMTERDKVAVGEQVGEDGELQRFLKGQAKKHGVWIVGGTIPVFSEESGKVYATSLLIDAEGEVKARYDKIHLFDVTLEGSNESYTESETTSPGDRVVVVDTPFGKLGLAICYDLRFPELFRAMAEEGMQICAVPSAFTSHTGKAHWESLIRARAIENLCVVIAADQGGYHVNGRDTYGDSMIVDQWGTIMNRLPSGSGVVIAEIDLGRLENTRKVFPVLDHKRIDCKIDLDRS